MSGSLLSYHNCELHDIKNSQSLVTHVITRLRLVIYLISAKYCAGVFEFAKRDFSNFENGSLYA